jgi:hypothetical protein
MGPPFPDKLAQLPTEVSTQWRGGLPDVMSLNDSGLIGLHGGRPQVGGAASAAPSAQPTARPLREGGYSVMKISFSKGEFGEVYAAKYHASSGQIQVVAVKVCSNILDSNTEDPAI